MNDESQQSDSAQDQEALNVKVMVIDDSKTIRRSAETLLKKAGREVVNSTFAPFEVWFTVALLYLLLTGSLSWLVQKLEKRLAASD